jgi:hypothetical protein
MEGIMGEKGAEATSATVAESGLSFLDPIEAVARLTSGTALTGGTPSLTPDPTGAAGELGAEFDASSVGGLTPTTPTATASAPVASSLSDTGSLSPDSPTLGDQ